MRLNCIVVLAVALLACVDYVAASTDSKAITRNFPTAIHSTANRMLRGHHATPYEDDEERAPLEKVTGLIKAGVETAKLRTYSLRNKYGVQVLTKLKLDNGIVTALKSSKMDALATYVNMFNKKHPNEKISVIGTLTSRYGDATVAKALVSAMDNPQTKNLATRLRSDQLEAWWSAQKSVDDVFNLLKLRDNRYEALISRKLGVLEDYIRLFNSRNVGHDTLLNALGRGFGGQGNLASMLNAAKFDPRMEVKAMQLENSLITQWLDEKLQPSEVLKLLNLGDDATDALKNSNLRTLRQYISESNKNNPNSEVSMIGVLTTHFGDEAVASALVTATATRNPIVVTMARNLQTEQFALWMNSGKSADDAFKLLKFPGDNFVAITSPKLETLEEYIKLVNGRKSETTTLLQVLTKGYGEGELALKLVMAKALPSVHGQSKAQEIQAAQFAHWVDEGYDPISVLTKFYKVDASNLNAADVTEKAVAKQFKAVYDRAHGVRTDMQPRRS